MKSDRVKRVRGKCDVCGKSKLLSLINNNGGNVLVCDKCNPNGHC